MRPYIQIPSNQKSHADLPFPSQSGVESKHQARFPEWFAYGPGSLPHTCTIFALRLFPFLKTEAASSSETLLQTHITRRHTRQVVFNIDNSRNAMQHGTLSQTIFPYDSLNTRINI